MLSFLTSLNSIEQNSYNEHSFADQGIKDFPKPVPPFPKSKKIETEKNLVSSFESTIKRNLGSNNISYLREFVCSDGIADLVICEHKKNWTKNINIGKIPSRWVYALFKLPYRKNFSTDEFAKSAGISKKAALNVLKHYSDFGYCLRKTKKDYWTKIKQPIPIANKIYAIEGKLRNWKKALSQAFRYLDYANQSWVVLDKTNIKPALKNIDRFKKLNIGLASISSDGNVTSHFTSEINPPRNELRFWQANAEIAKFSNFLNNFEKKCL